MHIMKPVALVTGASSGFGLLTAAALARAGFTVLATMRDVSKLEALQAELLRLAGAKAQVDIIGMDVSCEASVEAGVKEALAKHDRIDVLINNAGFAVGGFVEDVPLTEWRRQMDTNFFGLVAVTKAVLPAMRAQRSGCIINLSSISGRTGFPGYAPYAASKFAVEGFSESLRMEVAPFGIRVVLVEPGAYRTGIWSKGLAALSRTPGSAYAEALEAVLRYTRATAEQAPDAQHVADRIVRIARTARPRLRYAMGTGARLTLLAKAVLPWAWFERLVLRALRRSVRR
jgi:NAD(P)-dependent dehydrogenase (short-subunit alcohol dehydrogenase family)